MTRPSHVTVAVIQAAPVLFDRTRTIEKACALIAEAAAGGARVIVFPEAFVPAYPRGLHFGAPVGSRSAAGRALFARYWEEAVEVPSPAVDALAAAARAADAHVAIGIVERETRGGRGTLYCSTLYLTASGDVAGVHRKLKPTAAERIIWGEGDGSTLTVMESPYGRIGGLICWEHYMPLARMAMLEQGVDLWVAPTADARESWQATMVHVACEGRCFVLSSNQYVTRDMLPADLPDAEALRTGPGILCRGGSVIVSPMGEVLAGPLYDREGILTARLDLAQIVEGRFDLDVTGHYARPDVFQLHVERARRG
ncbi:MAG: carbon-nitrogen hydrolase family protein [Gemmatimonadaceae bacterium]|nr:carbon-nitrogen hydrolase family protein [Gemmatimonadaceae bacterium]